MNKNLKVAFLDTLTIKPYILKYVLFMLVFSIFFGIVSKQSSVIIPMFFTWSIIFASYPFAIGDKHNMNTFYNTLSISRKNIVKGRYIFTFISGFIFNLLGVLLIILVNSVLNKPIDLNENLFMATSLFCIFSLFITIQMPLFFKYGYTKAKFISYFPIFVLGFGVPIIGSFFKNNNFSLNIDSLSSFIESNSNIISLVFLLISILLFKISCVISTKIYKNLDL